MGEEAGEALPLFELGRPKGVVVEELVGGPDLLQGAVLPRENRDVDRDQQVGDVGRAFGGIVISYRKHGMTVRF